MRDWLRATRVYLEPRVLVVLLLGLRQRPAAAPDPLDADLLAGRGQGRQGGDRPVRPGRAALHLEVRLVADHRPGAAAAVHPAPGPATRLAAVRPDPARPGDPGARRQRPAGRPLPHGPVRGARGVPVGEPGHRHRCLPRRAARGAAAGCGCRHGRDRLSRRHAAGRGRRPVRRGILWLVLGLRRHGRLPGHRHDHRPVRPGAQGRGGAGEPRVIGRRAVAARGRGRALRRLLPPQRARHGRPDLAVHHALQAGRCAARHHDQPVLRRARLHQARGRHHREGLWPRRHAARRLSGRRHRQPATASCRPCGSAA